MMGIVELAHFVTQDLKIFAVLWRNPSDGRNSVVKPLWYSRISASMPYATPRILRGPPFTLMAIHSSIESLLTNIFASFVSLRVAMLDHCIAFLISQKVFESNNPRGELVLFRTYLSGGLITGARMDHHGIFSHSLLRQLESFFLGESSVPGCRFYNPFKHFIQVAWFQTWDCVGKLGTTICHINQMTRLARWSTLNLHERNISFTLPNCSPERTEFVLVLAVILDFGRKRHKIVAFFQVMYHSFNDIQGQVCLVTSRCLLHPILGSLFKQCIVVHDCPALF
mmetsp:Transcript_10293/g.18213  ORF Transcript_10293/g.18213 Transcript_10293/m.18213 type:complete len:282 (-) Transcript_10293:260-1105(-)